MDGPPAPAPSVPSAMPPSCASAMSGPGRLLGLIPVLGSLALAIGYSVVTGWIFKYTADALTGTLSRMSGLDAFAAHFNATAAGNVPWQLVGMAVTIAILAFGIGRGIELPTRS